MDAIGPLLSLGVFILNIVLLIWVTQDAKRRGTSPVGWGIAVFLLGVIAWFFYLLTRPALASHPRSRVSDAAGSQRQASDQDRTAAASRPLTPAQRDDAEADVLAKNVLGIVVFGAGAIGSAVIAIAFQDNEDAWMFWILAVAALVCCIRLIFMAMQNAARARVNRVFRGTASDDDYREVGRRLNELKDEDGAQREPERDK